MSVIDIKSIKKVKRYKKKGLGTREIARLMGKDPTQIHRWLNYKLVTKTITLQKKVLTVQK